MANGSNFATYICLISQPYGTRPIHNDLNANSDDYNPELCWYQFMVNLDRCNGIQSRQSNTPVIVYPVGYVPNKTEDVNFSVFDMISRMNEPKTLAKHMQMQI